MKHLLIILSLLLLTSPLFGQSSKFESVSQCVLQTMTEKKLTGNEMFEVVKEECERILGKVENEIDKKQEGVLYKSKRYGKWKWYKTGNEDTDYKYVGEIKNGKPNGRGVSTSTFYPGKKMEGEWKDGELHGQGTETVPYGGKYVGEYKNGRFHVQGTYTWSNGEKYVGEWKDGERNGQGTFNFSDGGKYVGEWKNGEKNGQGTYTFYDRGKYVGGWKDGKQHGQGTLTIGKGKFEGDKYEGDWKDGKKHGQGTVSYTHLTLPTNREV